MPAPVVPEPEEVPVPPPAAVPVVPELEVVPAPVVPEPVVPVVPEPVVVPAPVVPEPEEVPGLQQFAASSALTQGSAWQSIFALSSTSPFAPLPAQNVEMSDEVAIELHFADVPASGIQNVATQTQPLALSQGVCSTYPLHDMVAAERNEV